MCAPHKVSRGRPATSGLLRVFRVNTRVFLQVHPNTLTTSFALCYLPVVTVAGLAQWIIRGSLSNTRTQQQWVVLPHAVQLFVKNSKYSESTIRVALSGSTTSTTSNQYRRATPSELAWLKQQGAVDRRSTLVALVSLSKCLEVGKGHGVPTHILEQLKQQPQAVSLPTTAMAAAPAPPQATPTAAHTASMPGQYSRTAAAIQPVCPATLPHAPWSQDFLPWGVLYSAHVPVEKILADGPGKGLAGKLT